VLYASKGEQVLSLSQRNLCKQKTRPLRFAGINSTEAPIWYIDGEETVAAMKGNLSHHRSDAPLGYATKVHALAYVTRFREVLMVDSDCTLLVAPEAMFRIPEYVNHGNLFWPGEWWGGVNKKHQLQ
jgi:hypothetical protein